MQITRNSIETTPGPSDWFTGTVYIDPVATPSEPSRLSASSVHFTPGARTAWHTHPNGQTIYVTEGIGRCQRQGGAVEVIHPGDRVLRRTGVILAGRAVRAVGCSAVASWRRRP
jgi:quercetin dioxygenase-like cupin family protein